MQPQTLKINHTTLTPPDKKADFNKHNQKIKIKEIFVSLQGEGPYVGKKQIFVRTTKCNLNCAYCDTDFKQESKKDSIYEFNQEELFSKLKIFDAETVSFTGGEPLLETEFLKEFLKNYKNKLNKKIYLETNGTLFNEFEKVAQFIDVVSMDIKLKSAAKQDNRFLDNEKFIKIAKKFKKEIFVKVVFDENISESEISAVLDILKKHKVLLILQPKMPLSSNLKTNAAENLVKIYDKFYSNYKNVRLIPQVHKFLDII